MENRAQAWMRVNTYTEFPSMNSSSRSFNRLSLSQCKRNVTSAGRWITDPDTNWVFEAESSWVLELHGEGDWGGFEIGSLWVLGSDAMAGIDILYKRWLENNSSSPPPNSIFRFKFGTISYRMFGWSAMILSKWTCVGYVTHEDCDVISPPKPTLQVNQCLYHRKSRWILITPQCVSICFS